jgi:hypothetical protein
MKHPALVTAQDLKNSEPLLIVQKREVSVNGVCATLFICSDELEMGYYQGRLHDSTRVTADFNAMPQKIMFDKGNQS